LSLTFNALKSMCLAIGKLAKLPIQSILLNSSHIQWVNSIKYVYTTTLYGGKSLRFDYIIVKHNFLQHEAAFMLMLITSARELLPSHSHICNGCSKVFCETG
jgi:hypothetical protein